MIIYLMLTREKSICFFTQKRPLGQAVKTSPFHGGNTGSIPVGVTYPIGRSWFVGYLFIPWGYAGPLAQLVRASGS